MRRRVIRWSGLLVIGLFGCSLLLEKQSGSGSNIQETEITIFSPALYNNFSANASGALTITGEVRNQGLRTEDIELELIQQTGNVETIVMTTTTLSDGSYQFSNAPGLVSGESYRVRFKNSLNGDYSGYLYRFDAPLIVGPRDGVVSGGIFDIAFVPMNTPRPYLISQLPVEFTWSGRVYSEDDAYGLVLSDLSGEVISATANLGSSTSFSLAALPSGMQLEKAFLWAVQVFRPDGGYGVSAPRQIVLSSSVPAAGIHGRVTANGIVQSGVELALRHYQNGGWETLKTTITQMDGSYYFDEIPSLGSQEIYYIRYLNPAPMTEDYLFEWQSYTILQYEAVDPILGGIFDVSNIALITPTDKAAVGFPVDFQWSPRSITGTESYQVHLYMDTQNWYSPEQIGSSHYLLGGLPEQFEYNQTYNWAVWVRNMDGGRGISRFARRISFLSP